jgi:transposase
MLQSESRPVRSRAVTRQLWVERMRRFTESGVTVVAFCQAEDISSHAFYYWKHKFRTHDSAPADAEQPRLLPVRLLDSSPVELALPNGCSLRLAPGCDLAFVRSLVDALGDAPC